MHDYCGLCGNELVELKRCFVLSDLHSDNFKVCKSCCEKCHKCSKVRGFSEGEECKHRAWRIA